MIITAKPNPQYRWYDNLRNTSFFAEVANGRKVTFHLVEDGNPRQVSQEFVREFFPEEKRLKFRPFTKKNNRMFYAILYRNRRKYREAFEKLLSQQNKPFHRTK